MKKFRKNLEKMTDGYCTKIHTHERILRNKLMILPFSGTVYYDRKNNKKSRIEKNTNGVIFLARNFLNLFRALFLLW